VSKIIADLTISFFVALGVVLGGSIIGSLGATLVNHYPADTMIELARQIKVWAVLVALGGTFPSLHALEAGLFEGQLRAIARQLIFILISFSGAHLGYMLSSIVERGLKQCGQRRQFFSWGFSVAA
jgi:hypothetical protein